MSLKLGNIHVAVMGTLDKPLSDLHDTLKYKDYYNAYISRDIIIMIEIQRRDSEFTTKYAWRLSFTINDKTVSICVE